MAHLLLNHFFSGGPFSSEGMGLWIFLSIGAVCLFGFFIPMTTYLENQRKEREAFYRAETARRLADAPSDGARAAIELFREQERLKRVKAREGLKIGGLVNIGVGVGLLIMMYSMLGPHGPYMVGAIPGLIGVAMLVYVFFMAEPLV